jgi:hypothetical protein
MEIIDRGILNKVKTSICEFAKTIKDDNDDLYNRLVENSKTIERLFLDFNKYYSWPMLKPLFSDNFDLAKNTLNGEIRRFRNEGLLIEGIDYVIDHRGPSSTTHIHDRGAKKILERMDSIEGTKYLFRKYGINKQLPSKLIYIRILYYAVKGIDDPKREFKTVNDYRIDLYLKIKKLAIECDEHGHEHETDEKRFNRQQAIENYLECRFLRFNPHPRGRNFDIGFVITVVLHYLFNKLINGKAPIDYFYEKCPEMGPLPEVDLADYD